MEVNGSSEAVARFLESGMESENGFENPSIAIGGEIGDDIKYAGPPTFLSDGQNGESPSSDFEIGTSEFPCVVRFLHDDKECGKIIGKGGGRIKEIRSISKASVQLTKGTSLYPGTKYRVMKVMGDMGSVLSAVHLVLSSTSPDEDVVSSSPLELRMLIPEQVVGALIGKGGRNIKEIKESTGATVYIKKQQPMHPDCPLFRITSIQGTDRALLQALAVILTQLYSSGEYHDLIDVMIPFQHPSAVSPQSPLSVATMPHGGMHRFSKNGVVASNPSSPAGSHHSHHRTHLDYEFGAEYSRPHNHFASTSSGPVDQSDLARTFFEMFQSFQKLSPSWKDFQQHALMNQNSTAPYENQGPSPSLQSSPGSSTPAVYAASKSPMNNGNGNGESAASPRPAVATETVVMKSKDTSCVRVLAVPDEVIGALIGTKGKTIQRIKYESGAAITISGKGDYLDDTSNRKITVTGSAKNVQRAQEIIIQKVSHYSMMRARHEVEESNEKPYNAASFAVPNANTNGNGSSQEATGISETGLLST